MPASGRDGMTTTAKYTLRLNQSDREAVERLRKTFGTATASKAILAAVRGYTDLLAEADGQREELGNLRAALNVHRKQSRIVAEHERLRDLALAEALALAEGKG